MLGLSLVRGEHRPDIPRSRPSTSSPPKNKQKGILEIEISCIPPLTVHPANPAATPNHARTVRNPNTLVGFASGAVYQSASKSIVAAKLIRFPIVFLCPHRITQRQWRFQPLQHR